MTTNKQNTTCHKCFQIDFNVNPFLSFCSVVEGIPQLNKTPGRTGQTLRACTPAEAFQGINDFSLVVLKKTSEKIAEPL